MISYHQTHLTSTSSLRRRLLFCLVSFPYLWWRMPEFLHLTSARSLFLALLPVWPPYALFRFDPASHPPSNPAVSRHAEAHGGEHQGSVVQVLRTRGELWPSTVDCRSHRHRRGARDMRRSQETLQPPPTAHRKTRER